MSGPGAWHGPAELLQRFARTPEGLDDVAAASLEEHLISCSRCRVAVAGYADQAATAAGWAEVADRVDQPRALVLERLLGRIAPAHALRVVAATPALRLSWAAGVLAVIAATVASAHSTGSDGVFLVVAPFVALAGVAVCFLPGAEPAGEAAVATPMHGAGLLLLRTAAVLGAALAALGAGALALPGLHATDAAWILPALAVSLTALALCTRFAAHTAAGLSGLAWLAAVQVAVMAQRSAALPATFLFTPRAQIVFALIALTAAAVVAVRRADLERLELP
jgi:hypothetical protein